VDRAVELLTAAGAEPATPAFVRETLALSRRAAIDSAET